MRPVFFWRAVKAGLAVGLVLAVGAWLVSRSTTWQLWGRIVARVETTEPMVALTFDDGPVASITPVVLDILAREGVRATFFLTGAELEGNPEAGRLIAAAGHELGNPSFSHRRMVLVGRAFVADEIGRTDRAIRATGYAGAILFRPPYGKKLWALPAWLAEHDRTTVTWDVAPDGDPATSAEAITAAALAGVRQGSILLLHVMYPGRDRSRAALPLIIQGLRAKGFRFVTVSELRKVAG